MDEVLGFDLIGGCWQWEQDLSQVHELTFWSLLFMIGYLSQLDSAWRALFLLQLSIPDFVDLSPLRSRWWVGGGGDGREVEWNGVKTYTPHKTVNSLSKTIQSRSSSS